MPGSVGAGEGARGGAGGGGWYAGEAQCTDSPRISIIRRILNRTWQSRPDKLQFYIYGDILSSVLNCVL